MRLLQVRPLKATEISLAENIERAVQPLPWSLKNFRDALAAGYWCALASPVDDGQAPVGVAVVMSVLDEAELLTLSVAPLSQRQGVGRSLIEAALAAHPSARVMHLEVRASNQTARRFYEHLGFKAAGLRRNYYAASVAGGAREDAVLMSRKAVA